MMRKGRLPTLDILVPTPIAENAPSSENNSRRESTDSQNPVEGFPEIKKENLERLCELGKGTGGVVYKARNNLTDDVIALKLIHLEVKQSIKNQIIKELRLLQRCSSPFIVGFHGAFISEGNIAICMEFMDGLSLDLIAKRVGLIGEELLGKINIAVLSGLKYLKEEMDVLHRDVKPSNILVNTKGEIKLCDFGVSVQLINSMANSFVGTRSYMAPERLSGTVYNVKSDLWSLGMSLVELAIGRYPIPVPTVNELAAIFRKNVADLILDDEQKQYAAANANKPVDHARHMAIFELLDHIVSGIPPTLPRGIFSDAFTEYIHLCLVKDMEKRATLQTLLGHDFVRISAQNRVDFAGFVRKAIALPLPS
uniref:mitogen-activated protein kinase kinase n=1 Tax=Romanomermis culicivorax TaxID=13658 RepID=A0A915JIQ2_ROMCU